MDPYAVQQDVSHPNGDWTIQCHSYINGFGTRAITLTGKTNGEEEKIYYSTSHMCNLKGFHNFEYKGHNFTYKWKQNAWINFVEAHLVDETSSMEWVLWQGKMEYVLQDRQETGSISSPFIGRRKSPRSAAANTDQREALLKNVRDSLKGAVGILIKDTLSTVPVQVEQIRKEDPASRPELWQNVPDQDAFFDQIQDDPARQTLLDIAFQLNDFRMYNTVAHRFREWTNRSLPYVSSLDERSVMVQICKAMCPAGLHAVDQMVKNALGAHSLKFSDRYLKWSINVRVISPEAIEVIHTRTEAMVPDEGYEVTWNCVFMLDKREAASTPTAVKGKGIGIMKRIERTSSVGGSGELRITAVSMTVSACEGPDKRRAQALGKQIFEIIDRLN